MRFQVWYSSPARSSEFFKFKLYDDDGDLDHNEQEAHKPKGGNPDGWEMPYGKLLADLGRRTEGRVMRADKGVELLEKGKPEGWSERKWQQFTKDTLVVNERVTVQGEELDRPFFIQYTVRG